jgi:hypothetical protein
MIAWINYLRVAKRKARDCFIDKCFSYGQHQRYSGGKQAAQKTVEALALQLKRSYLIDKEARYLFLQCLIRDLIGKRKALLTEAEMAANCGCRLPVRWAKPGFANKWHCFFVPEAEQVVAVVNTAGEGLEAYKAVGIDKFTIILPHEAAFS